MVLVMLIRAILLADLEAVIKIIRSHVSEDGPPSMRYFEAYFERIALGAQREKNYVAVDAADRIAGVCGYGPDQYDTEGILWLKWFYVRCDCVGTLIGYRLFEQVLKDCIILGTRKLCLDTSSYVAYAKALKFYRSAGFVLEGVLKDYYGNGEDMLIMGKSLS
jgi:hypothetical protein